MEKRTLPAFKAFDDKDQRGRIPIPYDPAQGDQVRWNEQSISKKIAILPVYPNPDIVDRMVQFINFHAFIPSKENKGKWEFPGSPPLVLFPIDFAYGNFTIRLAIINPEENSWIDHLETNPMARKNPETIQVSGKEPGTGLDSSFNTLGAYIFARLRAGGKDRRKSMSSVLSLSQSKIMFAYRVYHTPISKGGREEDREAAPRLAVTMREWVPATIRKSWGEIELARIENAEINLPVQRWFRYPRGKFDVLPLQG